MGISQEKVLEWLISVETDPARAATLASGGLLHHAAAKDGLVEYDEPGAGDLARRIAELRDDGLVVFAFGLGSNAIRACASLRMDRVHAGRNP